MVRGAVVFPHGLGKTVRVAVFAKGDKAKEALDAGADIVGDMDLANRIQNENFFDFDKVIATPDMMGVVGRIGRILGLAVLCQTQGGHRNFQRHASRQRDEGWTR